MNYTRPELAIVLEQIKNAFLDAKARSLVMELKDDSKSTFAEAIGLSTYNGIPIMEYQNR